MNRKQLPLLIVSLALAVAACSRHESRSAAQKHPNAPVIVISIDTLRADHLPAYGYKNVETPGIDAIRRDGILFANAYSEVPLTLPSHVAMLTGMLPPDNGVRNNLGYTFNSAQHETLPALLRKNGYATGAAVSAYVLRGGTGLRDAFDFYDDKVEHGEGAAMSELQRPAAATTAVAERWIEAQGDRPFFFMLHLYEPHAPYTPPEPYRSRFKSPYDGEIATADAAVGTFIDFLKTKKIYDRAIVVLMSDHGEGLMDHGEQEHGVFLYREDLHVPLIVKLPASASANTTVSAPAALIDIFPTVASLTGIKAPALRGVSLLDLANHPPRSLYAETLYPRIHLGWSDLRSLIDDRHHYIKAPNAELYDFTADPAERKNILADDRRVSAAMREALDAYGSGMQEPSPIDPEEAKKLAALGYLSSTTKTGSGPLPDPKDHIGEIAMANEAERRGAAGDKAGAIAGLRAVLAKNPSFTDAWVFLARQQDDAGLYEDAIESYKRANQLAPELAVGNALWIATLDLKLQRYDDAEKNALLAERTNPSDTAVLLGRIAMARHNLAGAEQQARAAIAASPDSPRAKVFLAQVYVAQQRYQEAMQLVEDLTRELNGKPPVAMLDYVRGDLLAMSNRPDQAIEAFRREIRNFPSETQPYANLAVVYLLTGRKEEARQTMHALLRAVPGPQSAHFAAQTLNGMGAHDLAAEFERP